MPFIYFITHPNVQIIPELDVRQWSLSSHGLNRMQTMLSKPWVVSLERLYCSTEKKAIDGAKILSEYLNIAYTEMDSLGENDRTSTGYLPVQQFESLADQFFARPGESVRGWETALAAQQRIVSAVEEIARDNTIDNSIGIVSHGAVGTLLLCYLNRWQIDRRYDQPANGGGNYFCFNYRTNRVIHGWQAIDD